jgi:hypothetical protein
MDVKLQAKASEKWLSRGCAVAWEMVKVASKEH